MNEIMVAPQAGMTATNGFTQQSIEVSGETLSTVMAARAKAEVEARFIMAERHPRDWDTIRINLLKACERPGFAKSIDPRQANWGVAWYRKPIGNGIEGFSVRFAEECIREMGNLDCRSNVLHEDDKQRHILVDVMDLEKNVSFPQTIVIEKTIERRQLKKGETAISMRENSQGQIVYLRAATDDEILPKQNSLVSKALRNAVLRLVPGDIQAECRERILQIRSGGTAENPTAAKKATADAFAKLGVSPADLKKYLGHKLDSSSPAEIARLRDLYRAISNGDVTWADVVAEADENVDAKKTIQAEVAERPVEVPEAVDVFDELSFELSKTMTVQEKAGWIKEQCEKAGWDSVQLTEAQASALLDVLNNQKGGQNESGGNNDG
jgi:hypothetical protein